MRFYISLKLIKKLHCEKSRKKVASGYIRKVFFKLFFTEQMLPFLKL